MPFTFPNIIKDIIRLVYRKRNRGLEGRSLAGAPHNLLFYRQADYSSRTFALTLLNSSRVAFLSSAFQLSL